MIHFNSEDHGRQIMKAAGADFSPRLMSVISRSENGVLYGGVVYENYTGKNGSLLVHIAGFHRRWINRDLLWVIFDYPFRQLDCKQAFAQVRAKEKHTLKFCLSFGWKEVITLEGVFPDDDMILLRMLRDECRFLNLKPRKLQPRRTPKDG